MLFRLTQIVNGTKGQTNQAVVDLNMMQDRDVRLKEQATVGFRLVHVRVMSLTEHMWYRD